MNPADRGIADCARIGKISGYGTVGRGTAANLIAAGIGRIASSAARIAAGAGNAVTKDSPIAAAAVKDKNLFV